MKARAALIFLTIYGLILVAALIVSTQVSLSSAGERHHAAPAIALTLAAHDMVQPDGSIRFRNDSSVVRLAARNPSFWLLVDTGERRLSLGEVPSAVYPLFDRYVGVLESGRFHVPGVARPLSDAAINRVGRFLVAAGGLDPETISFGNSLRYFLYEGPFVPLLILGIIGFVAMLLALPLLTRALKPVAAEVNSIRPEQPDRRISETRVPTELFPVVRGFNSALDRLSEELARRRRFIADAAHELKTPLSIITLQVEALEEDSRKDALQRVVARMSNLVGQMLDVERLSLGGHERTNVDLVALARGVVAEMAPLAIASGYELSLEAPPAPVLVSGDPHALSRAISNLVANAVAHAGGHGEIRVLVRNNGDIEVSDEGPGVPESIRASLFEPFCRGRWDRDGCGLGLHLTREIMRAHGGEAVLLNSSCGATFRLALSSQMRSAGRNR